MGEPTIKVIDYRGQEHPLASLQELEGNFQVWAEAEALMALTRNGQPARSRDDLEPGPDLVVWTAPPDRVTWEGVLERLKPDQVVIYARLPETDVLETFLSRLAGLVKYALKRKEGRIELSRLAGAMAHSERTVRAALDWMASQGHLTIAEEQEDAVFILPGEGQVGSRSRRTPGSPGGALG